MGFRHWGRSASAEGLQQQAEPMKAEMFHDDLGVGWMSVPDGQQAKQSEPVMVGKIAVFYPISWVHCQLINIQKGIKTMAVL